MGETRLGANLQDFAMLAGWPTATVNDATGSAYAYANGDHERPVLKLPGVAKLTGWPTPNATESGEPPDSHTARNARKKAANPNLGGLHFQLSTAVQLTGWATPTAWEAGGTPDQFLERKRRAVARGISMGVALTSLNQQAALTGWATPMTRDQSRSEPFRINRPLLSPQEALIGPTSNGSGAATANTGQLNPAFSRWLMGYPPVFCDCAGTAMRSSPRSRRRLSVPTSTSSGSDV